MIGAISAALLFVCLVAVAGPATGAAQGQAMDLTPVTKTVTVGGLAFPVADFGSGPPVLLLHGFPDDRHLWRYQVPALAAAGFRVIAPDLRGFGDAPRPQDPKDYGISIVVADVIGILDALGIKQVQLVAHDWGAAVGWALARQYPDRITRYVALSVGIGQGPTTIEQLEKSSYMPFFRQAGTAERELTRDNWKLFRAWTREAADTDRYIKNLSRPGALTAALNWYRATGGQPAAPGNVQPVTIPVLGIWSDGDAYLLESRMTGTKDVVKGPFRYEKISGASHWMQIDKPAELNRLLLGFLQK